VSLMAEKADRYISSEEKLLGLIRRKDQQNKEARSKDSSPENPLRKRSLFSKGKGFGEDWLTTLNNILMILVFVLAVYFVMKTFGNQQKQVEALVMKTQEIKGEPLAQENIIPEPKPLDYYLNIVENRNIFNTSFDPMAPVKNGTPPIDKMEKDPRNHLRLVGIVMDQNPQAIIEDSQSKETFFLFKGDKIDEITVEDILENKVVITYRGQPYELSTE